MRTCVIVLAVAGALAATSGAAVTSKAIWLFDGNANDSENDYDGTPAGAGVTYVDDHPNPVGGAGYDYEGNQALSLDGSADAYVRVETDQFLSPGSGIPGGVDVTVQLWLKTASDGPDMRLVYMAQTTPFTPHNWQISMTSGTVNVLSNDGNWDMVSTTGTLNDGEWHHIVYTNDGSANTIYVDGVLNNSADAGRIRSNWGEGYPLDFGKQSGGVPSYVGLLDEVRISMGLPDNVEALYLNSLAGGTTPPETPGDANGDGAIDDDDLSLLLANWGQDVGWGSGNFNGDDTVNDDDLSLLLSNWTGAGAAVPEPACALILLLGACVVGRRRK